MGASKIVRQGWAVGPFLAQPLIPYGSYVELTWRGESFDLGDGSTRKFMRL